MAKKVILIGVAVFFGIIACCFALRPDHLRVGLLLYGPAAASDPYPLLWRELAQQLERATSIETDTVFKNNVSPVPEQLSELGLIYLLGTKEFRGFSERERKTLANWVRLGGGLLVMINTEAENSAALDKTIREETRQMFPDDSLERIPATDALFKSFYLVRSVGGVLARARSVEGIKFGERYGVIYSPNDLFGALVRDREGNYLFRCYPGGEDQRKESFKLAINIMVYALTGTYKSDVIHLPFIEQKLKGQ